MKAAFLFAVACHCLLAAISWENAPFGVSDASVLGTNSADGPLVLTRIIPLPGVTGGLNHMSATQGTLRRGAGNGQSERTNPSLYRPLILPAHASFSARTSLPPAVFRPNNAPCGPRTNSTWSTSENWMLDE
jgi:hypothetical protein